MYLFCSLGYVNNLDESVSQIIICKCDRLKQFKKKEEPSSLGAENGMQISFFLQETHSTIGHEWGAEIISSSGTSDACGVAVLFERGVDCKILSKLLDPEGRYIILKVEIQDKPVVLINVYAPNKNTELTHFFTNILTLLQNERLDCEENILFTE